jgi:O-glycosyl hydrolase
LLNHLRDGAAAGLFYEGYDSFYEHHASNSLWGLIARNPTSGTYIPRKRFFAIKNVSKFITAGSTRIAVSSSSPLVQAFAFQHLDSRRLTIIGHNSAGMPQTITVQLSHVPPVPSLAVDETNARFNMRRLPDLTITDGRFVVQSPADSFFTLTATAQ